jgi:hypothetical protein
VKQKKKKREKKIQDTHTLSNNKAFVVVIPNQNKVDSATVSLVLGIEER